MNSKTLNNLWGCECCVPCHSATFTRTENLFRQLFLGRVSADSPPAALPSVTALPGAASFQLLVPAFPSQLRATQKGHSSFSTPHGVTLGLGYATTFAPSPFCFLPSPFLPIHSFSSQGHFLRNYLHADFHFRVCFLGNPSYSLWLPLFLSF